MDARRGLHRSHNQDLARVARFRPHAVSFLCECGAADCEERVHLTVEEYEAAVAVPDGYVAAPGHDQAWRQTRTG
jgi:hypothetical protein